MNRIVSIALSVLLLVSLGTALAAQDLPDLVDISGGNHSHLKSAFNKGTENVRMVVILSPT